APLYTKFNFCCFLLPLQFFLYMKTKAKTRLRKIYELLDLRSTNTITLFISLVALIISVKTCFTSNKALTLSQKQGEPFIQVSNAKLVDSLNRSSFITVELTLKNLGQIPAIDVSAEMDYRVGSPINKNGNS